MEPGSDKHSVYTHFPKDPNLDICLVQSCPERKIFGDLITADHKILSDNHRYAVVVQDLATQSQETQKSLMKFLEPKRKPNFTLTIP